MGSWWFLAYYIAPHHNIAKSEIQEQRLNAPIKFGCVQENGPAMMVKEGYQVVIFKEIVIQVDLKPTNNTTHEGECSIP